MITVDVLEADCDTLVTTVPAGHVTDGEVQDMVSGDSLGRLSVGLEWADRAALSVRGRVLRWNGTGTETDGPFHSVIEGNGQVSRTESHSKVPLQITVNGRGLTAQWEDVRVHQWPGMNHDGVNYTTRHFNYASPGKADEINGTVYDHGPVMDYDANGQPNQPDRPPPVTWREPTARRIGAEPFNLDVPNSIWLFRTTITTGLGKLILRHHSTADDRDFGWTGGVPTLKGPDKPEVTWQETWASSTLLAPGTTYDIVFRTANEYTAPGGSAAWLAAAGWLLQYDGSLLSPADLAYHSQVSGWGALELLDDDLAPGWTPPELMTVLLLEWRAEGALTDWTIVDMGPTVGVDWVAAEETNFETEKTTGLGVITQLEDGQAEFGTRVIDGNRQLMMFPPGTMGDYYANASPPEISDRELVSASCRWVDG